jgi:hypothetical protein
MSGIHRAATEFADLAADQAPEDVGKAGPLGLLLLVVLLIAVALLVKSMTTHLKRVPPSFDPPDRNAVDIPDTPEGIDDPGPQPGETLLEDLRNRPRAIEPPRADGPPRPADGGRPEPPPGS